MKKLFDKSETWFAVANILAYVLLTGNAENLSTANGIVSRFPVLGVTLVLLVTYIIFIKKYGLGEYYGVCGIKGSAPKMLLFIPMIIASTVNIWCGLAMTLTVGQTVIFILAKAMAGLIEEIVFRGFLFRAVAKDNVKQAVIITSLTFGIGHIVNLFTGRDIGETLIQIVYATAIGFMLTAVLMKSGSIIPCIIFHMFINGTSAVACDTPNVYLFCIILTVICAGYAVYIFKALPENKLKDIA